MQIKAMLFCKRHRQPLPSTWLWWAERLPGTSFEEATWGRYLAVQPLSHYMYGVLHLKKKIQHKGLPPGAKEDVCMAYGPYASGR
eukprot:1156561-Pelagomonas_calceolata.AAC.5